MLKFTICTQVSCLLVFNFRFNRSWFLSQKHRYIFHIYWILSIYNMLQNCFNIMFLYLYEFWRKWFFISKSKFWKIQFLCLSQISVSQNGSNSLQYVLIFYHTCLVFKYIIRTYFCEINVTLWDLIYNK